LSKGLAAGVKPVFARADSGFYCWQAVEAYEKKSWRHGGAQDGTPKPHQGCTGRPARSRWCKSTALKA
jgi:hypothetical protein